MKKNKNVLKSSILAGLVCLALTANGWSKDGSLTEIARPYLGEYTCEAIYFNGENKTEDFDSFKLEVCSNGEMKLHIKAKNKKEKIVDLTYEYDDEKEEFIVKSSFGVFKKEERVPYSDGKLTATLRFGGQQLTIIFSRK